VIPPGGEGRATLKLELKGFQGYVKKTATVHSDSPDNPRITLVVQGTVKALIEVRPEKTVYFQGMADQNGDKTIEISSTLSTFHIKKMQDTLEQKAACRLETVEDGKHYRLKISNLANQGSYRGAVTLYTDLAAKPELTVWVSGFIEGEIGIRPNTLVLGQLAADQPVLSGKVLVVNNRNKLFRITKCTYDEKVVSVKQAPVPDGTGFSLEVTPNMANIPLGGRLQTNVTIETDVASGDKHEVQVQLLNLADAPK
jgi:hypothetical protein